MSLSREDVEKIAHLARLALRDEQIEQYQMQLSAILEAADTLNELDLDGVPPTTHALPNVNRLREDSAENALTVDDVLANAPKQRDNQFVVQAILDE